MVALGCGCGAIHLWDIEKNEEAATFFGQRHSCITSVAFSPDGTILAGGQTNDKLRFWKVDTKRTMGVLRGEKSSFIEDIAFSKNGRFFAMGFYDHSVCVWNIEEFWKRNVFSRFSGLISDHLIKLNRPTIHRAHQEDEHSSGGETMRVVFSPDGSSLASCTTHTIRFWEVSADVKELSEVSCCGNYDYWGRIRYSPDGKWVAAGKNGGIHVWHTETGKKQSVLKSKIYARDEFAVSPDGAVITGFQSGKISFWDIAKNRSCR